MTPKENLKLIILWDSFFKLSNILELPKVLIHEAKDLELSSFPQYTIFISLLSNCIGIKEYKQCVNRIGI